MNTLFTVRRSLRRSRSPLRWITVAVDAGLDLLLSLRTMVRGERRRWRRSCSIFRRVSLRPGTVDVNHFTVPVIASDWVVAFAGAGAGVGAQRWPRNVPRSGVFHLQRSGKSRHLVFVLSGDVDETLMRFRGRPSRRTSARRRQNWRKKHDLPRCGQDESTKIAKARNTERRTDAEPNIPTRTSRSFVSTPTIADLKGQAEWFNSRCCCHSRIQACPLRFRVSWFHQITISIGLACCERKLDRLNCCLRNV